MHPPWRRPRFIWRTAIPEGRPIFCAGAAPRRSRGHRRRPCQRRPGDSRVRRARGLPRRRIAEGQRHPARGPLPISPARWTWRATRSSGGFLESCDLDCRVGFDAVELIKPWRLTSPVIHIDSTPNTDQVYPADIELVGSIPAIVNTLPMRYTGEARWTEGEVESHRESLQRRFLRRQGRRKNRIRPTSWMPSRQAFPANTIVTTDVGSHKLLVGQGWKAYEPRSS